MARKLSPQPQTGDQRLVTGYVLSAEVFEEPPALGDHTKKPAAGVDVLFMDPQVPGQMLDSFR